MDSTKNVIYFICRSSRVRKQCDRLLNRNLRHKHCPPTTAHWMRGCCNSSRQAGSSTTELRSWTVSEETLTFSLRSTRRADGKVTRWVWLIDTQLRSALITPAATSVPCESRVLQLLLLRHSSGRSCTRRSDSKRVRRGSKEVIAPPPPTFKQEKQIVDFYWRSQKHQQKLLIETDFYKNILAN